MILNSDQFLIYNGVIALITILMIVLAYRRGFVREFLNIVALIASVYLSILGSEFLASKMNVVNYIYSGKIVEMAKELLGAEMYAKVEMGTNLAAWFLILLIGLRIFFWIVVLLIPKYRQKNTLSMINHILGMILGFVKAFVVLVLLTVILNLPIITNGKDFVRKGVLAPINMVIETVITNVQ